MNTMGIYNSEMPPYASSLIFELHRNPESSEYTVKISYRNDTLNEPYVMDVPGCGTPCELTKLEQLMSPLISENWDDECHSKINATTNIPQSFQNLGPRLLPTAIMITTLLTVSFGILGIY